MRLFEAALLHLPFLLLGACNEPSRPVEDVSVYFNAQTQDSCDPSGDAGLDAGGLRCLTVPDTRVVIATVRVIVAQVRSDLRARVEILAPAGLPGTTSWLVPLLPETPGGSQYVGRIRLELPEVSGISLRVRVAGVERVVNYGLVDGGDPVRRFHLCVRSVEGSSFGEAEVYVRRVSDAGARNVTVSFATSPNVLAVPGSVVTDLDGRATTALYAVPDSGVDDDRAVVSASVTGLGTQICTVPPSPSDDSCLCGD